MSKSKQTETGWFFSGLTILFIGLKLTNYITWSWWWVLSPIWLPFVTIITGAVIWVIIAYFFKPKPKNELSDLLKEYGRRHSKHHVGDN